MKFVSFNERFQTNAYSTFGQGQVQPSLTDNHKCKFEALLDAFPKYLVWKIRKTYVAIEFLDFLKLSKYICCL